MTRVNIFTTIMCNLNDREQLENEISTSINPVNMNSGTIFFAHISEKSYFTHIFDVNKYDLIGI